MGSLLTIVLALMVMASPWCCARGASISDNTWGTFKPQLLWNLSQKKPNYLSVGLIYQLYFPSNQSSIYAYKFANRDSGIFADYRIHDGYNIIEEIISDQRAAVDFNAKYMKNDAPGASDGWSMFIDSDNR